MPGLSGCGECLPHGGEPRDYSLTLVPVASRNRPPPAKHVFCAVAIPCRLQPMSAFISRTACEKPTSTARDTIEWPMLSSPIPSRRATGTTLR